MAWLLLETGPYRGKWRRYYHRALVASKARDGYCRRCHAQTADVGAGGWYYRRGELGQLSRQLCPPCMAALQA
jgi:hypothetical protein